MHAAIPAGPRDDPPSYEAIDAQPHNRLFMHLFRQAVVDGLGEDTPETGSSHHDQPSAPAPAALTASSC
jgi:hypothetical protein